MHQEIKATVIWLALAFFLTFAGFWQAKVAIARASQAHHRELPPPAKTKHAIRPPAAAFTGDVVEDYIARCEKGITDREIGWILEDFHNAGLDLDWRNPAVSIEKVFQRRVAQHRWYRDALVDGFRFTPEQSTQVTKRLDELFEHEKQAFLAKKKSRSDPSDEWIDLSVPFYQDARDSIADLSNSMTAVTSISYVPWELCQLTHEQEKLTWKQWFLAIENENLEISNKEVAGLSGGPLFRASDPYEGYPIDESLENDSRVSNVIFPLLAQQKLIARKDPHDPFSDPTDPPGQSVLENVRLLHPCQFKAHLLFNRGLAAEIQMALDKAARSAR